MEPDRAIRILAPRSGGKQFHVWKETCDHAILNADAKVLIYAPNRQSADAIWHSFLYSLKVDFWGNGVSVVRRDFDSLTLDLSNGSVITVAVAR